MSVTELRDRQNAEWHAWAERKSAGAHAERKRECEYTVEGGRLCREARHSRGLCRKHRDMERRKNGPLLCNLPKCHNPHHSRGLCEHHRDTLLWRLELEERERRKAAYFRAAQRRRAAQDATRDLAHRNGEPWAEWEFDLAMSDTPLREVAIRLGRTYSSVVRARQRRRRMLGLGIEYTKTENDPYDGSDRRGVLYAKDTER